MVSREDFEAALLEKDLEKARLERTSTELALARRDLEKSHITAPFSGFLSERYISEGSYVKDGSNLFKLLDISSLKVSARVPEKDLLSVKPDLKVTIRVPSLNREFSGAIYFISPDMDEKTRSFEIRARVKNPGFILKPGLLVDVTLITGVIKDAFVLPENAALKKDDSWAVFVVKDDTARERMVKVEERTEGAVVVTSGIEEGEAVVVEGAYNLTEGARVKVVER
jgi:RND family efflux transporter MFP subunit